LGAKGKAARSKEKEKEKTIFCSDFVQENFFEHEEAFLNDTKVPYGENYGF
jgi:hypothetical protein